MDAQGNLYGTTGSAVYEIAAGNHDLSTISPNFPDDLNSSLAIDGQGNLYGTNTAGQIFELSPAAASVPEPATLIGLAQGVGLLGLGVYARSRRRA